MFNQKFLLPILLILFSLILGTLLAFYTRNSASPKTFVISQNLYNSLAKRELLKQQSLKKDLDYSDLVKVASASSFLQPEAILINKKEVWLTTGSDGQVSASIPQGKYKVTVEKISGIDIINIPSNIEVKDKTQLDLGLSKGTGRVTYAGFSLFNFNFSRGNTDKKGVITISLFSDLNSNGKKDQGESNLNWTGVTLTLTKT